jgi:hypothetical protein
MSNVFGSRNSGSRQFRLIHVGVAAALAAATVAAIGVVHNAGAASSVASSYIPIVPCRLADTRPGVDHVGVRAAPLGAGQAVPFAVWGTNGNCTIPGTATGIASNVTAVNPSSASYVTIYPSDASPRPTASNLNFVAGSPPTPNQVTVALSATGAISAYNNGGTVDLIIDIVGYYLPAHAGAGGSITYTGLNATFNPGAALVAGANGCVTMIGNGAQLFVPLTVPDGATIVAVRVRSYDGPGLSGFVGFTDYQLFRVNQGISETLVASFSTVDNLIDTPMVFSPQIPVSLGNAFYLKATATNLSPQKLCAVTVDYTM